jgi:hypothetical protein
VIHRSAALLIVLSIAACDGGFDRGAATERDSAGVTIVESLRPGLEEPWRLGDSAVVRIPSAETDPAAERPVSVVVGRDGRILVADAGEVGYGSVLVYDADGGFLFRAGGAETGSEALTGLAWAAPYLADSIVAFDLPGRRLVVFDPAGALARELAIPFWRPQGPYGLPGYTAGAVGPTPDGRFLTFPAGAVELPDSIPGPAWFEHELLRVAPDGVAWDTLGVFPIFQTWVGESWIEPYPFGAVAAVVPHPQGFVTTRGEAFEIQAFDTTGALRHIVRRGHSRATVNEADLGQFRSWYLQRARANPEMDDEAEALLMMQLERAQHPERKPAISHLLVDPEGNVWAEEFRWVDSGELAPEPRAATWSVFRPDGRWLTQVELPAGLLVSSVSGDRVLGFVVNEQGRRTVVAYPLIKR